MIAATANTRVADLCCGMGGLSVAARAIAKIQPDCAVIENVSTVLAEKHGDRLESFREVLTEAGYHVEKKVLDSSEYGVPQKRKRAFFFVTRSPLDPQRIDDLLARHKVPPVTARDALHGLATPAIRSDIYDDEAEVEGPANHFGAKRNVQTCMPCIWTRRPDRRVY